MKKNTKSLINLYLTSKTNTWDTVFKEQLLRDNIKVEALINNAVLKSTRLSIYLLIRTSQIAKDNGHEDALWTANYIMEKVKDNLGHPRLNPIPVRSPLKTNR